MASRNRTETSSREASGAPPTRGQGRQGVEPAWLTAKRKAESESGTGGSKSAELGSDAAGATESGEKKAKRAWVKGKGVTKEDDGSKHKKKKDGLTN